MNPERPNHTLHPCAKCSGTLTYEEDYYGPYVKCLQCGTLLDLSPSAQEVQDGPPPRPRNSRVRTGLRTQERQEMYRKWVGIIRKNKLSVRQAAERFGVSGGTIYRILAENRPEPDRPEEND